MFNTPFPIRKDSNGLRPVFFLGNEGGNCRYKCTFCDIGKSSPVSSEYNIELFNSLYLRYEENVSGPNHPLIYNRGNITEPFAFSRNTLDHILNTFNSYDFIRFLSINSREKEVTIEFLKYIVTKHLKFPLHFVLGIESFCDNLKKVIGKSTTGELDRLIERLKDFNILNPDHLDYQFGIDVGLLFLPELYFGGTLNRREAYSDIKIGFLADIKRILELADDITPIEINVHPYYKVEQLPFENADIDQLISYLPDIEQLLSFYNKGKKFNTHVFIGFRPSYDLDGLTNRKIDEWSKIIESFNTSGKYQN